MKILVIIFILSLSLKTTIAQDAPESSGTAFSLFKSKTYVKNPLELRDPFKRKINKRRGGQIAKTHVIGIYNNQVDRIEDKPIENIRIVGVIVGAQRRAMAKIITGKTLGTEVYYIKEGMKIGPNAAEVKAILPGGVVLVEKIRNVYDQDEYLETVIPVFNE